MDVAATTATANWLRFICIFRGARKCDGPDDRLVLMDTMGTSHI